MIKTVKIAKNLILPTRRFPEELSVSITAKLWGGSPGRIVMGDDSCLRGRGFKSRRLDGLFHIYLL